MKTLTRSFSIGLSIFVSCRSLILYFSSNHSRLRLILPNSLRFWSVRSANQHLGALVVNLYTKNSNPKIPRIENHNSLLLGSEAYFGFMPWVQKKDYAKGKILKARFCKEMELGSFSDPSQSTFSLIDEDHTFANAIRFTLNQDPRMKFCGYSIPHPSDNRVNIRIQTTEAPAKDVFKDACQNLVVMCQHVSSTFDKAVVDFKMSKSVDIESDG